MSCKKLHLSVVLVNCCCFLISGEKIGDLSKRGMKSKVHLLCLGYEINKMTTIDVF